MFDAYTRGASYNTLKDGDFLFLLLWVSRYYAIIRRVQLDGYYFAYKQNACLKPGMLALIISCVPRARTRFQPGVLFISEVVTIELYLSDDCIIAWNSA